MVRQVSTRGPDAGTSFTGERERDTAEGESKRDLNQHTSVHCVHIGGGDWERGGRGKRMGSGWEGRGGKRRWGDGEGRGREGKGRRGVGRNGWEEEMGRGEGRGREEEEWRGEGKGCGITQKM